MAIHSNRYSVPGRDDPADVHQNLYQDALRSDSSNVYQSELPELALSVLGRDRVDRVDEDRLVEYYGADDWSALSQYLTKNSLTNCGRRLDCANGSLRLRRRHQAPRDRCVIAGRDTCDVDRPRLENL